ncbi:phosphopantetheine-binding protein [Plantactinospora sp. B6F1]|uniref:phosphopantetheine-binding protein n=1 Tax=Plantactinospora sp. B6F1 TaxID=3158971 RepID=UPI00102C419B
MSTLPTESEANAAEPEANAAESEANAAESEAIESLLDGHPDVAEFAVVRAGARRIVAVTARLYCAAVDIRDDIWESVPVEQLPDLVLVLPELPRDAENRVLPDRIAHRAADDPGAGTFSPPQTPTEVALADIWREILGRRRVAADDNFLDLGGDSMTATLLLDSTNERFDVALSFDELLSMPSLRAVAEAIDQRR